MSRPPTWTVREIYHAWRVTDANGFTVADVRGGAATMATALLIGAAPELAASLSTGLTADDLERIADHLPARLHVLAERLRTRATAERLALALAGFLHQGAG